MESHHLRDYRQLPSRQGDSRSPSRQRDSRSPSRQRDTRSPSRQRDTRSSGSAIFNALIASLGTAFTIVTVVFAILTWKVAVQAENTAIVQAQIGLLQYCAPNVPTTYMTAGKLD